MLRMLTVLLLTLAMTSSAAAELIVDTGSNPGGITWDFSPDQYFAGEFSLDQSLSVNGIQGFFQLDPYFDEPSADVTFAIHTGGGPTPGDILFSTTASYNTPMANDWHGVAGLDWALDAGTYWVSFRPGSTAYGTMRGGAPNPLEYYVIGTPEDNWTLPDPSDIPISVGIRIDVVPEPSTCLLGALALLGLLAFRRARLA